MNYGERRRRPDQTAPESDVCVSADVKRGICTGQRSTRQHYFPLRVSLTLRFFRPLALRRASTLRPFLDAMRDRKPCLFALLRRLGWYVRFILSSS